MSGHCEKCKNTICICEFDDITHEWTRLIMPWPPSLNNYRVPIPFRRAARLITSEDGVSYAYRAQLAILTQRPKKYTGPMAVRIYFHPKRRRFDMDNFRKALYDAMTKASVWEDDSLVWVEQSEIREPVKGGAIVIDIRNLDEHELARCKTTHEALDGKSYSWIQS